MIHHLKTFYTILSRDIIRFSRNRGRIVASMATPVLFLFVFGGGLGPAMAPMAGGNLSFEQFMFPGVIAMTVLFTLLILMSGRAVTTMMQLTFHLHLLIVTHVT